MPFCKNCHARISKFDKDLCPVCGVENPLDGASSDTVEITTNIQTSDCDFKESKIRRKSTLVLLFCLLGFTGAPYFYLKNSKAGALYLLANVLFIGIITLVATLLSNAYFLVPLLITIGVDYLINIGVGIFYLFLPNVKDKEGVYLH